MSLDSKLYAFDRLFVSSFLDWPPVYTSPKSKAEESSVAECDNPSYDPWDADCPNVKKRIHTKIRPLPEMQSVYLYSRRPSDLLWAVGICLVKEEHVPKVAAEGFSGLEFRPVSLFRDAKCRKPMEGYVEMRAVGRVPIDLERSGIAVEYACPYCGLTRYLPWDEDKGLHFVGEPDEWPEVFMPAQQVVTAIFVKPRFAQLMVDLGLRPFMLVRLEDMKPYKPPTA